MNTIMDTVVWEVKNASLPKVIRYCKKCGGKSEYVSAGLFRVNAQQKCLDVWLIFRCARCKTTWNCTILSRVNPRSIPREKLEKFMENDPELARSYGMDCRLLRQNGAQTEPPAFVVTGQEVRPGQAARIRILSEAPLEVGVAKILREKLRLSGAEFNRMVVRGAICPENGADLFKPRLTGETVVRLHADATCGERKENDQ